MSAFEKYMTRKVETRAACERYNGASIALDNARIHERLAEMLSQHEPLCALKDAKLTERSKLYAAAYYVVHGRMPSIVATKKME